MLVIVFGLLSLAAAPQTNDTANRKANTDHGAEQAKPHILPVTFAPVPTDDYYRPCDQTKNQSQSDLCAQWTAANAARDAANWAKLQFGLSILGLAGLITTLILTWASTRAATGTLAAQIAAERPLLQLQELEVKAAEESTNVKLRLDVGWNMINYGRTGAWIEALCVVVDDRHDDERIVDHSPIPLNAFIAPETGIRRRPQGLAANILDFNEAETANVRNDKRVFLWGYSIYRDAGGRRWKTGFAGSLNLNDEMEGAGFSPQPLNEHWIDIRLPNSERWYRRLYQGLRQKRA